MNQVVIRFISLLFATLFISLHFNNVAFQKTSNSSGKCMYCNVFFHHLAAHMLSSETCMLASQQSLSSKRVHQEKMVDKAFIGESIEISTCAKKRPAFICDEQLNSTSNEQNHY